MNKNCTLKKISAASGISIASISRYMKDHSSVKPVTAKKIEYSISSILRQNNKSATNLIAVIVPELANQFFPLTLQGIESVAASRGYTLIVSSSHGDSSAEDKLIGKMISLDVAGIICVCADENSSALKSVVKDKQVPIVFLDRTTKIPNVSTITSDNNGGMYQGAKYLLSLGHRKVLYLSGPENVSTEKARYKGFLSALGEKGLSFDEKNRVKADFNNIKAYHVVSSMIEKSKFDYTAICASNDLMAIGAYMALSNNNIKVPEDVSIIGYGDIPSSTLIHLTTISQPFEEMGRVAILELIDKISYPLAPAKDIVLPSSIVIRDSCMMAKQ